jgi:phage shock protein PspC (stress-responsive transcriptional regulator)
MKRTLTVNLNGRVFNIDEDAYQLLDNYLKNLRIYFCKEEGNAEILADFEARIEELFNDRVRLGYNVITIEDVEKIIAQMGQPTDFGEDEEKEKSEKNNEWAKNAYMTVKKKFYRNPADKMFAGLCSGMAVFFDWNVLIVRLIAIVLIPATSFWIVPVYLIAWLLIPEARTAEQKLEMQGKPVTVENIGKTVAAGIDVPAPTSKNGCLHTIVDFTVAFFKVCLIGLGIIIGIPLLFALAIVIIVLFATIFGVGSGVLMGIPWLTGTFLLVNHPTLATIAFCLIIGIPLLILVYSIASHLFKLKPVHKGLKWAGLIAWILACILFVGSGFKINGKAIRTSPWSWHFDKDDFNRRIMGDGILSGREETLPPVKSIEINGNLNIDLQIESVNKKRGESTLWIDGDSNLIDKIKVWVGRDGELVLSPENDYYLSSTHPFIVRLQTSDLEGIKLKSIGNLNITRALHPNRFFIQTEGTGKLRADSLYCGELSVKNEGVSSVTLAGTAGKVRFELEGAGEIKAFDLTADSVYARVDGVGAIRCNPIQHLKANVNGVGKIVYKTEPQTKDTGVFGVGKIGLE